MAITVLELAVFRGAKEDQDGSMSMGEVEKTGLPFMGGCGRCGACVAAYNASPSTLGYLMCSRDCIGEDGFDTVEAANIHLFPEEYQWQGIKGHNAAIETES
jgi:hypothetical protein